MPHSPDPLRTDAPSPAGDGRRIATTAAALLALAATLPLLGPLDAAATDLLVRVHGCMPMAFFRAVGVHTPLLSLLLVVTVAYCLAVERWRAIARVGPVLVSLGAGCLLTGVLKNFLQRPRPGAEFLGDVGGSFPSGHVANTLLLGLTLLVLWSRPGRRRAPMAWGIAAVVLVVAAARVYEGRHWPSDVVCTAALALAYGLGALLHPDPRWRAGVTAVVLLVCGALDLAARHDRHLVLQAGTATPASLVRALPFGAAYHEGMLRGAWSLDAPDPHRSSAWLRSRTGAIDLGALDPGVTTLRVVSRPHPGGEGARCCWLHVELNGRPLGDRLMHRGWRGYTFPVEAGDLRSSTNEVRLTVSDERGEPKRADAPRAAFSALTLHGPTGACEDPGACR